MQWELQYHINEMDIPFLIEQNNSKISATSNAIKKLNELQSSNPFVDFFKIKKNKKIYIESYILNSKGNLKIKPKSSKFKSSDFIISPLYENNDIREGYVFESHNSIFNYFFIIGKEPEVRGLVGDSATFHMKSPITIKSGDKIPKPQLILTSIINKLNRGEY